MTERANYWLLLITPLHSQRGHDLLKPPGSAATALKRGTAMPRGPSAGRSTFEIGSRVSVFWTGENKWYDGVVDSQRKEGGRCSQYPDPEYPHAHHRRFKSCHVRTVWCTE